MRQEYANQPNLSFTCHGLVWKLWNSVKVSIAVISAALQSQRKTGNASCNMRSTCVALNESSPMRASARRSIETVMESNQLSTHLHQLDLIITPVAFFFGIR